MVWAKFATKYGRPAASNECWSGINDISRLAKAYRPALVLSSAKCFVIRLSANRELIMRTNRLIGWIVGLLVIQYALGMLANMYSDIPNSEPWQVFHQPGFITFHTLTGVALLVLAIAYVVLRKRA